MRAEQAGVVANSELVIVYVTFCSKRCRLDTWTKKRVAEVDPCQEEKQCLTSFWIQSHDLQNESPTLYHSSWKLHFEQNLTKWSQGQKFNLFLKLMFKNISSSSLQPPWLTILYINLLNCWFLSAVDPYTLYFVLLEFQPWCQCYGFGIVSIPN